MRTEGCHRQADLRLCGRGQLSARLPRHEEGAHRAWVRPTWYGAASPAAFSAYAATSSKFPRLVSAVSLCCAASRVAGFPDLALPRLRKLMVHLIAADFWEARD